MKIAENRLALRARIRKWKRKGLTVALVPTMGNLHEGHIALVTAAKALADRVVTSSYINPAQFAADEDLDRYPRTPDADYEALSLAECDLLFSPKVDSIYPHGLESSFKLCAPDDLGLILEGEFRPGHFDGVATVVSRLFNLVNPDVAVFGEKDFQQLQIIRRMVADMGFDIRISALPTVRDEEGLALSSRNRYLDSEQVQAARNLSAVLRNMVSAIEQGDVEFQQLELQAYKRLEALGLRPDYVSIRRERDLSIPVPGDQELRVLAAVWCGKTRLIDNFGA